MLYAAIGNIEVCTNEKHDHGHCTHSTLSQSLPPHISELHCPFAVLLEADVAVKAASIRFEQPMRYMRVTAAVELTGDTAAPLPAWASDSRPTMFLQYMDTSATRAHNRAVKLHCHHTALSTMARLLRIPML